MSNRECMGRISGDNVCGGNVSISMKDYKCLCVAVIIWIWTTLVNTHRQLLTGYTISSASCTHKNLEIRISSY